MKIAKITTENKMAYEGILPIEEVENLGRKYYRGLAIHEASQVSPKGILIWKMIKEEKEGTITSHILRFWAGEEKAADELFLAYEQEAKKEGITRTRVFLTPEGNEGGFEALKKGGFTFQQIIGEQIRITVGEIARHPMLAQKIPLNGITSIGNLEIGQLKKGIASCLLHERPGGPEDILQLPLDWYEPEVSSCVLKEDRVNGVFLIHKSKNGKLFTELLFAFGEATKQDILAMVLFSMKKAAEIYPKDTPVQITFCEKSTKALAEKLFPEAERTTVMLGENR